MTDPYIEQEEQTSCWNSPDPKNCKMLPAEVKFDKAVYGGISYWAQAITGIILTRWGKYGGGKKYFEKAAKWVGPKLYPNKTAIAAAEEASSPIMVTTMIMVGNAFLLPVKWLEDRKPEFVRKINDWSNRQRENKGEVISEEERAYQEQHLQVLEKAPKQTWMSLLGGRAFGLAGVYAVLFALGNKNNEAAEKWSAKAILKTADAIGLKKFAKSKTVESYIHVGFLDVFYSAVSAGGLYVYSHFLHPHKKHDHPFSEMEPTIKTPETAPVPEQKYNPAPVEPNVELAKKRGAPAALYTQKLAGEAAVAQGQISI